MEHGDLVGRCADLYAVLPRDNGSERLTRLYDAMTGLWIPLRSARRL